MAGVYNYTWQQGEDLTIALVYKSGPSGAEVPVDLTAYSLRMDIGLSGTVTPLYVFNSTAIADTDPNTTGAQADNTIEATLGADGTIMIAVPRSVTLPEGPLYTHIMADPPVLVYAYDIFLRDGTSKQKKILQGQIQVDKSVTLWA